MNTDSLSCTANVNVGDTVYVWKYWMSYGLIQAKVTGVEPIRLQIDWDKKPVVYPHEYTTSLTNAHVLIEQDRIDKISNMAKRAYEMREHPVVLMTSAQSHKKIRHRKSMKQFANQEENVEVL